MFQPGEVVLVPFPFTDFRTTKRRPVLVLASPDALGDIVCLAVTSSPHHDPSLPLGADDFVEGTLPKPSWVRLNKVYSLHNSLIAGSFGILQPQAFSHVLGHFCVHFGCSQIS